MPRRALGTISIENSEHLSRLLEDVMAGEEVVITRRGEEIASLVPARRTAVRQLGVDRSRFIVPDDFDAPLPERMLAEFE